MAVQVEIGGRIYAAALQWAFATDKADLARTLRRSRVRTVVSHSSDDGLLYGFADESAGGARASGLPGTPAAALMLAQLAPTALVHHTLPSGQVWVCAARDGLPLPGSDRIHNRADAARAVDEFLSFQPGMPLYGDLPIAAEPLASLFEKATPPLVRRCTLRPARRGALRWLATALVLALAGAGWMYSRHAQRPSPAPATVLPTPTVDVAALESAHARQIERAIEEGREKMLLRPVFGGVAQDWIALVRSLPLAVDGYRPRQIECSPGSCRVEWNWDGPTYHPSALQRLPGKRIEAANPMDYATRVQTLVTLTQPMPARLPALDNNVLEDMLLTLGSALRRDGARVEFSKADKPVTVALPPPPPALAQALRARAGQGASTAPTEQSRVIGRQGRVRLLAVGWSQTQAALGTLATYPMVPERAVLTLNQGQVSLQLEASYVVPLAQ